MPAVNLQHGIYVSDATNVRITHNTIDHNADRGIQLYASSIGGVIGDNVIAFNGEGIIFSGEAGGSSNNNLVQHVVNSLMRSDIESWYPAGVPLGSGNLVSENCVSARGIDTSSGGFSAQGNVTAAASDIIAVGSGYGVRPGSACAAVVPDLVVGPAAAPGAQPPVSAGVPAKSRSRHAPHATRAAHAKHRHRSKRHHHHHHNRHALRGRHGHRRHGHAHHVKRSHGMSLTHG